MSTKRLMSIAAALCAAGMVVRTVSASPAGMAVTGRQPSAPAPAASTAVPAPAPPASTAPVRIAAVPSRSISPLRHPVKYFATAISEMPIPSILKSGQASPPAGELVEQSPTTNDPISATTTTGAPTPHVLIQLAQASEQQGDVAQARQQYQQALAQWPGHVDLLRAAARMEDRLGQLPQAESLYQQAVDANPQHPGALNDLGLCLARQGKLDQSVQVLEQAIHLQPDKALYRNNAATVLVEMRQDQRALAHMAAVHGTAQAQYNMGQLLVARGRAAEAGRYFQAALIEDPQMEAAGRALAQLSATPTQAATRPPVAAERVAPTNVSPAGPQFGPQMGYPSEARTPGLGRSTYVPPAYRPPTAAYPGPAASPYPQTSVPWVGQATPRYLPPVGTPPANTRR